MVGYIVLSIFLFLLGVVALINPFPYFVADVPLGESIGRNLLDWFVYRGGALSLGILLLMASALLYGFVIRRRLLNNSFFWANQCPKCGNKELVRVHRRWQERLMGKIWKLPIKRYHCTNCSWSGQRLDQSKQS